MKVGYHPGKFGSQRPSDSGDIVVLFCHDISHYHVIKESFDFAGRSPSRHDNILPSLVALGTLEVGTCF